MPIHASHWFNRAAALALAAAGVYLLATLDRPAPIEVTWQTGSESDVAGFNVWRSEPGAPVDVPVHKVNEALIPARGNALSGADYSVEDAEARPGDTYVYQIEEVDATGRGRRHPDTVTATAGWPRGWVVAEAAALIGLGALLLAVAGRQERGGAEPRPGDPVTTGAGTAGPGTDVEGTGFEIERQIEEALHAKT